MFAFTLVGAAVHVGAAAPLSMSPQRDAIRQVSAAVSLAAAIDTSSNAVGIAESELYFMTPEEVGVALDTMQSLGVTQFRMFIPWRAVEATPDTYNWAEVDKVIDAAEERGMAVLGAVTSTPTWASDVQDSAYGAPRDPADFGDFMGELASRYGAGDGDPESARISAYEIWNEPQSFVFWSPKPDPAAYTELLKAGYTAIKEVDPTGTVVGGVVTAGLSWGDVNISPVEFVQTMYESGAAGYFDALSYHPYNYDWKFGDGAGNAISAVGQLEAMQALMEQYGDGDKDVWTSEYGLPTSYVSEAQQAEFIDDFMDTWSEHEGTGPMFIYSLVDRNSASTEVEDTWGLFRDDYTPKQAAAIVQAWIEENGPIPSDSLPPIDEIPDIEVPTVPTDPVTEEPATPTPADPVAEAVANWQAALAEAAANWAAAWGQPATTAPATTTLSADTAAEPEVAPAEDDLAESTVPSTETDAAPEVGEPTSATDPALESTDSARAALVEATQAEPTSESGSTETAPSEAETAEPTAADEADSTETTGTEPGTTESDSATAGSTSSGTESASATESDSSTSSSGSESTSSGTGE
ncbi:cellulase family glycosylhydrolase [Mycolicibacterium sp. P9-22]|uniref:cellulase family glycosylhydrolase n=1 Tax=Mycolicibacterium sp. P9-22 TaxID=2024613 RepID=UPI00188399AE|nr:cellulase family glycosylhydrolase [Mycolicibacterium sp. P9-22]